DAESDPLRKASCRPANPPSAGMFVPGMKPPEDIIDRRQRPRRAARLEIMLDDTLPFFSRRREAMRVSEAMHKSVAWVSPQTKVPEIAKIMKEHDIGAVPVGENDRLIG